MKQFTDSRIDSDRLAHAARTKLIEIRIGELVVAVKRAVRDSSAYRLITLAQYDQIIIGAEKVIRKWLVTSPEKDIEELLQGITGVVEQLEGLASVDELHDLEAQVSEQIALLNTVGFFSS